MTHPMPDQTTTPPPKRMTTAEVAALAQGVDNRLDDLSAVVTDLATRLQDLGGATGPTTSGPSHDQVDARIHEALAPLHDEVHELRRQNNPASTGNLDAILARLEEAERKVAAVDPGALTERVATELHPGVAELRRRLAAVEEAMKAQEGDPVSHTLAEDVLADQVEAAVERALTDLSTTTDVSRARTDQLARDFADLRQYVETHGTHVTQATVNAAGRLVAAERAARPLGAARKVLQLMQLVTYISKDRQAELGERGGRFKFRGVDEAMDAVGHAMREVGLILSPEVLEDATTHNTVTKSGTGQNGREYSSSVLWTTTKLTMRYTFVDPDDGSTHPLEMVGEGRDASDKSTSKAASMAFKYGLLQALCIPVTGLDDSDAAPPQHVEDGHDRAQQAPSTQPKQTKRSAQAVQGRATEALSAIRNVYRVEGGPQAQCNRLVQIMNQVKSEGLLKVTVEGSTLDQHGQAAMRTLQAPPPMGDSQGGYVSQDSDPGYPPQDGGY
jgi:ERF superfamily